MRAQIETLERTEGQLRAEILERTRAMEGREEALRKLAESEGKLRKIFETSTDAITITRLSDGRYLDFNDGFCVTGYSREEAMGSTAVALGLWADRRQLRSFMHLMRTEGTVPNLDMDVRFKNGTVCPYLISATIIDLGGEACIVAICRDIATIKQSERDLILAREMMRAQIEALEETEERLHAEIIESARAKERFRELLDSAPDAVVIVNEDGRIMLVNARAEGLFGYARTEMIGQPVEMLIPARFEQHAHYRESYLIAPATRSMGSARELFGLRKDGTEFPIDVSLSPLKTAQGTLVSGAIRDITSRKKMERDLIAAREVALAASQAKSEFLSSMSHEIRTPMNAILGMADILWESDLDDEQRRYLDIMRNNGNTLLELINEILDLAKVESGRLRLEKTPLDLRDLIEKLLDSLAQRAHQKELELSARITPDTPTALMGDPLRLRQILFNLIGNAIKFTQAGHIALTVEAVPPPPFALALAASGNGIIAHHLGREDTLVWIRFTVHDSGIGIAPDQLAAIFSTFTQADSSIARKYGGSGLGLAIVKRLVALKGGELTVESTPAVGSSFIVTVPLALQPPRENVGGEAQPHPAQAPVLAGVRVLLADADAPTRMMLCELLETAGATVEPVADAASALARFHNDNASNIPYNVFLVDRRMLGDDDLEPWRRQPGGGKAPCPIILMTTAGPLTPAPDPLHERDFNAALECRYLVKPIKRADLLRTVMEVTEKGPARIAAAANGNHAASGASGADGTDGSATLAAQIDARSLHVLLADDSRDNRMLIEAYLKKTRHTVDHAEDGAIAVAKVKANHYDLVLMDIQMPVMDGYTAVRTIRAWERDQGSARMPIIALTASALEESVQRSLEAGCDAHVAKPVKKATLFEAILNVTGTAAAGPASSDSSPPIAANGDGSMKRQQIQVDEYLRDLIPGFLEHKRADTGAIRSAIDRADYETISQIGHKLKGEGGSYGLDAVTELGATLERAALDKDLDTARHTVDAITEYLESVDVVYC